MATRFYVINGGVIEISDDSTVVHSYKGRLHCRTDPAIMEYRGRKLWAIDGKNITNYDEFISKAKMTPEELVMFKLKYNSTDFVRF